MTFVNPGLAIAGAAAMALPILIHLFLRRRQKPIEWAAMDLLRRAVQQSRRARRVERWILLVLRCLVLLLVGIAIARPASVADLAMDQPIALAVVLDDSAASRAMVSPTDGQGRTAFEAARAACIEEIRAAPEGSVVHVLTTSGMIDRTSEPVQPDRAMAILATLEPTFEPSRVRQAVDRADDVLGRASMPGRIVLASSFSRGAVDTEAQVLPPTKAQLEIRDVGSDDAGTAAIVSMVQRTLGPQAGNAITVDVTVSRPAGEQGRRSIPVTVTDVLSDRTAMSEAVFIEGSQRAVATVTLQVDPAVTEHAWLASIPADRQPADDVRAATISTVSAQPVLILDRERLDVDEGSSAQWLERALEPIVGMGLAHRRMDPADVRPGSLHEATSIIICRPEVLDAAGWAECTTACEAGALILVIPPTEETFVDWQSPCAALLGTGVTIRRDAARHDPPLRMQPRQPTNAITQLIAAELTELVAPIEVGRSFMIDGPSTTLSPVLVMDDGAPLMVMSIRGRGVVVMMSSAPVPSWSTLATKPIFVPLVQETIRQGEVLLDAGGSIVIGMGRLPEGTTELRPVRGSTGSDRSLTVDPSGMIVGDGAMPGIMQAISARSGAGTLRSPYIALNVDPSACDPQRNDATRLAAWINQTMAPRSDAGAQSTMNASTAASAWLLVVAALILLAETLLGRMFSVAEPKAA